MLSKFRQRFPGFSLWDGLIIGLLVVMLAALAVMWLSGDLDDEGEPHSAFNRRHIPTHTVGTPGEHSLQSETIPDLPPYPDAATTNDEYGAKEFVRYFYKVYDYAAYTNDLEAFQKLFDEKVCIGCNILYTWIENGKEIGAKLQSGEHILTHISILDRDPDRPDVYIGNFFYDREEAYIADINGKIHGQKNPPEKNFQMNFSVKWNNEKFEMTYLSGNQ